MGAAPMLMGLGSVISAVGSIREGQAAKVAAEYNAQVDMNNAALALQQSGEESRRQSVLAAKNYGSIKANLGASGLTGGTGLDVLGSVAANAELDNLTILHGGRVKAEAYGNEAALERSKGYWAEQGGYIGAASSLLKGGSTALYYGGKGSAGGDYTSPASEATV